MSTILQKKLARNIVENLKSKTPKNKQELVLSSGYSLNTATRQIPAVFEQKGVTDELKALGFDEYSAKKVVGKILLDEEVEPQHRLKAAEQVFKVYGSFAPDKNINLNLDAELTEDEGRLREILIELYG